MVTCIIHILLKIKLSAMHRRRVFVSASDTSGKLSNSRVTSLSFVRSYSTIIAYGSILDKNMFINNVRCYSKISDRSTDTKAVKVYTDLQNNKVSLIRENKGKSGIYR